MIGTCARSRVVTGLAAAATALATLAVLMLVTACGASAGTAVAALTIDDLKAESWAAGPIVAVDGPQGLGLVTLAVAQRDGSVTRPGQVQLDTTAKKLHDSAELGPAYKAGRLQQWTSSAAPGVTVFTIANAQNPNNGTVVLIKSPVSIVDPSRKNLGFYGGAIQTTRAELVALANAMKSAPEAMVQAPGQEVTFSKDGVGQTTGYLGYLRQPAQD